MSELIQPIDTSTCHPGFRCIVRMYREGENHENIDHKDTNFMP